MATNRICSIEGCGNKVLRGELCYKHYTPTRKNAPAGSGMRFIEAALALETDECVLWPYGVDNYDYGVMGGPEEST